MPDCPPAVKTPEPRTAKGAEFDPVRVDRVIDALSRLRHTQGKWALGAGTPLRPDPWQVAYIIAPVFGWVRWSDEAGQYVRIIRKLYVDVPRKNGKSTLVGGLLLYLTCADGEPGAQVIAAATTEAQAGFVFAPIKLLAEKSPELKPFVKAYSKRVLHPNSGSYLQPVANVAEAQHGANIHGAAIDELHIHKTPDMLDALETGTGSRSQPLVMVITTADSGKPNTPYDQRRKYVEQLARRVFRDETQYGVIWGATVKDDPFSVATQRKANPGYGISPTASYLAAEATKARNSPTDLARYLRLHLGIRTRQHTKYIDLKAWDRNGSIPGDLARFNGREAYGGLDLATTGDLCALCWLFPDDQAGGYDALWRLWTPRENMAALDKRTAGGASTWEKAGWLTVTEGNVADYDWIKTAIETDLDTFDVRSIGFDPWNASPLTVKLAEGGATLVQVRQGFQTLSPPTKELQRLVLSGTEEVPMLRHGGNPAIRWQVDNLAVAVDPAGNVKPDKASAADKIDGPVACIIALSEALKRTKPRRSAYADAGLTTA